LGKSITNIIEDIHVK